MYRIKIEGLAGESNVSDRSILDGVDCQENFSEYCDIDSLMEKGLSEGYMDFKFHDGELYVEVIYSCEEKLTNDELDELIIYTQGQMGDGIGEGFEQFPCMYDENDEEVYLSPWYYGQILTATQTEI